MKNPNWHECEIMLALDLYLNKDLDWITKISDTTSEIVALSKLLNALDLYEEKPNNFRSPGSIRMRFANFMALDERYQRNALDNSGPLVKTIWNKYFMKKDLLHEKCVEILDHHLVDKTIEVEEYIQKMYLVKEEICDPNFTRFANGVKRALAYYSKLAELNSDVMHSKEVKEWCDKVIDSLNWVDEIDTEIEYQIEWKHKEHAGINLAPIKGKRIKTTKSNADEEKIGSLVKRSFCGLVEQDKINEEMVEKLLEQKYSRDTFGLKHPFLRQVDVNSDVRAQLLDENGYVRYWIKPIMIHGQNYSVSKEWFENQRERYTRWLSTVDIKPVYMISSDKFRAALEFIRELDERHVSIKRKEILDQFKDEEGINMMIELLIDRGVLLGFQGSTKELVIDDYDVFYRMLNNPNDYA